MEVVESNVVDTVSELAVLVNETLSERDQSRENFEVILAVVDIASSIVSMPNVTLNDRDLVEVRTSVTSVYSCMANALTRLFLLYQIYWMTYKSGQKIKLFKLT